MQRLIHLILAILAFSSAAAAPAQPAAHVAAAPSSLTPQDLDIWMAGFMPRAIREAQAAGAVVVIVKDGHPIFARGYGYADAARKVKMDPDRSLVRPGSISKLFTAMAVMQLVEAGRLSLDADINTYLDFRIPDRFGKPIRLRQLLSHSAGFEDVIKDLVTFDPAQAQSLEHYVKRHVPARLYPPGEIPGYSNYGVALAGYIVQRVSNMPFETYVERNIFRPLGMASSTFRQPLPAALQPRMAKGYAGNAEAGVVPFEIFGPMPAGSLTSSGSDMARFMIASLNGGRLGDAAILSPASLQRMQERSFGSVAQLNGLGLGFWQYDRNGRRIVGHDGGAPGFRSNLRLFPDENVGLFMSFNGTGKDGRVFALRSGFLDEFITRYFPSAAPRPAPVPTGVDHGRMAEGLYASSGRSESGFLKLFLLDQVSLAANPDGTITLSSETDLGGQPKRWAEIAPFVWQDLDGQDRLAMIVRDGRIAAIAKSADPANFLLPVPASQAASWNLPWLFATILIFAVTVVAWPMQALIRRHYAVASDRSPMERRAYRLSRMAALLGLLFLGAWLQLFISMASGQVDLMTSSLDGRLRLIQALGLVAIVATAAFVWNGRHQWARKGNWAGKTWSILLCIAGLGLIWFSFAYNLISFDLRY